VGRLGGRVQHQGPVLPYLVENQLAIEHIFECGLWPWRKLDIAVSNMPRDQANEQL
jgi:hypothetical protein